MHNNIDEALDSGVYINELIIITTYVYYDWLISL